jgi:hypothetical protein
VVYASELNGFIGRGMFDECRFALENGIPVLVIRINDKGVYFTLKVEDIIKTRLPSLNYYAELIIK